MPSIHIKMHSALKSPRWRGVSSSGAMSQVLEKIYFFSQASICQKGVGPFFIKEIGEEPALFVSTTDEYRDLLRDVRHAVSIEIRVDPFLRRKILKGLILHVEIFGEKRELLQRIIVTYDLHGGYSHVEGTLSLFSTS